MELTLKKRKRDCVTTQKGNSVRATKINALTYDSPSTPVRGWQVAAKVKNKQPRFFFAVASGTALRVYVSEKSGTTGLSFRTPIGLFTRMVDVKHAAIAYVSSGDDIHSVTPYLKKEGVRAQRMGIASKLNLSLVYAAAGEYSKHLRDSGMVGDADLSLVIDKSIGDLRAAGY